MTTNFTYKVTVFQQLSSNQNASLYSHIFASFFFKNTTIRKCVDMYLLQIIHQTLQKTTPNAISLYFHLIR